MCLFCSGYGLVGRSYIKAIFQAGRIGSSERDHLSKTGRLLACVSALLLESGYVELREEQIFPSGTRQRETGHSDSASPHFVPGVSCVISADPPNLEGRGFIPI